MLLICNKWLIFVFFLSSVQRSPHVWLCSELHALVYWSHAPCVTHKCVDFTSWAPPAVFASQTRTQTGNLRTYTNQHWFAMHAFNIQYVYIFWLRLLWHCSLIKLLALWFPSLNAWFKLYNGNLLGPSRPRGGQTRLFISPSVLGSVVLVASW